MKVIRPVPVTDAILISSSVAETDYPAWLIGTTYALGDRVIKTATHRIYESLAVGNVGHDPADPASVQWMDIGPTNRWAMFDEAIGSLTAATTSMSVTLAPGNVDALAVLEVVAATVRVEVKISAVTVYDVTLPATGDIMTFLDLPHDPSAQIVVTIAGTGPVSVGVLLAGNVLDLGLTEASPTIGITDYSKRVTDEWGVTTVSPRTWAKTMTLRTKIDTEMVATVLGAVIALRAKPALWMGEEGFNSLTAYGFLKSHSIDVALPTLSFCSFSVEGLAQ